MTQDQAIRLSGGIDETLNRHQPPLTQQNHHLVKPALMDWLFISDIVIAASVVTCSGIKSVTERPRAIN